MQIIIKNKSTHKITYEHKKIIRNIIKTSLEIEGYNKMAEVSVTVVTNEYIKALNKEHRNINSETDVLSFPIINFKNGETPPKNGIYLLGDIVFSIEKAIEQAKDYGHSIEREIGFFIAHSMLHLMGYDHKDNISEKSMFEKQEKILNKVGLKR